MLKIMKNFKICALISVAVILLGVVFYFVNGGFATDIDFSGGCKMVVSTEGVENIDEAAIKSAVENVEGIKFYGIVKMDNNQLQVKTSSISTQEKGLEIFDAVKDAAGLKVDKYESCENISASLSKDLLTNALIALCIAIIGILIYICIRFELAAAIAAILALLHDALVMLAVYAIFRFTVNSTFVAAILTIIGYSVNATIIIFDRIRENKKFAAKLPFEEICEKSVHQTLRRTVNTTITTLIALVCLYILGAESIKMFAIPLIIGVVVGTYSSVCVSAPIWNLARGIIKSNKKKQK